MKKIILIILILLNIPVWAWAFNLVTGSTVAVTVGAGTVSYVSSGAVTHVEAGTTANTVSPAGGATGDLLIAKCSCDLDQEISNFDGFSLIDSQTSSTSRLSVGYLIDAGDASYDFTVASADEITCAISRFAKTSGIWVISDSSKVALTGAGDLTIPDLVVTQDNSYLDVTLGNDDNADCGETLTPDMATRIIHYTGNTDPRLDSWAGAVNAGTLSGVYATSGGGDTALVAIIIEAQ